MWSAACGEAAAIEGHNFHIPKKGTKVHTLALKIYEGLKEGSYKLKHAKLKHAKKSSRKQKKSTRKQKKSDRKQKKSKRRSRK